MSCPMVISTGMTPTVFQDPRAFKNAYLLNIAKAIHSGAQSVPEAQAMILEGFLKETLQETSVADLDSNLQEQTSVEILVAMKSCMRRVLKAVKDNMP